MVTNLLLIEDNHVLNHVETRQIKEAFPDVNVASVYDGRGARERLSCAVPDVVIMDCCLPDCSCEELMPEIFGKAPNARILVTSAAVPPRIKEASEVFGIFGILEKPYELEELVDMVRRALEACGGDKNEESVITETGTDVVFDRHMTLNYLSGLMAGLRALEADLRADAWEREAVLAHVDEYIPRLLGTVRDLTSVVKSIGASRAKC